MSNRKASAAAAALVLVVALATTGAEAEEQVLKFRLVTHSVEMKVIPASKAEGHIIGVANSRGVAIFEDGRIADKSFTSSFDFTKGLGPYHGYSTYTFEDGSTIRARFDGGAETTPDGRVSRGEYSELTGTGQYEGVMGTGWFQSKFVPWEQGANLFDGEFKLSLP
ncbi:MAG: hypothetical protein QNJ94_17195 [Alphaproteobacteria bacterium]|nr:hypothetical protein [Alphaproteobacteria bacterium]